MQNHNHDPRHAFAESQPAAVVGAYRHTLYHTARALLYRCRRVMPAEYIDLLRRHTPLVNV